jgi:hypothetical protein
VDPGKIGQDWPIRIRRLFDERDAAVHFGEETVSPAWHPVLESHVDPHVLRWGADAARDAVDLLLEVLAGWVDHPSRHTARWAASFAPSVRELEAARHP